MGTLLKTTRLTKVFDGKEVISDVDMTIRQGEIYGFLGLNGAGKTTVMKMMTNLIKPTGGEIEIFGEKLTERSYEILKRMGSIIEYPVFYDRLTAMENLELHCEYMGFYNKAAILEALDLVQLNNIDRKPVKDFSLGMRQRLGIARAITTRPELLLLDEPINGLDPVGIKELRSLFKMLSKDYGITLLISSHILGEIEQIADTVGVISGGRMIEQVSMDEVRGKHTEYIEVVTPDLNKAVYVLENKLGMRNYKVINEKTMRIYERGVSQAEISRGLLLNGVEIDALNKKASSLEDYFLQSIHGGGVHA
ncbi:ATP-binding cassette domain-containing protein [Paenibacillus sp. UNC499MF]|uniref:ATP-binding cassette domain-containing protein n=1 Tax=Paenibacillus sp. UNC499MF TaxID=1502751 RepID=UPI0008A0032B|nr:ATP-binding cassette domain-containing protein [Paenibacillus sp. UNC499MF]SEF84721.1 ABC-2 type transport system ATP-binding protein [Paenibacillus sp. UNC499MF]